MIWISRVVVGVIGLAGGTIVAAAVFALITSTGMMARLAARTDTKKYVLSYETAVILGGTVMNLAYVFYIAGERRTLDYFDIVQTRGMLAVGMLFAGMFIGCLAVSLSEAIKATAVFARRLKINEGVCYLVLAVATGKSLAVLLQFVFER